MTQITSRERRLTALLIVALIAGAAYNLALKPARQRLQTLQRILPEKRAQLRDLQAMSVQYTALKRDGSQRQVNLASQNPDFQLLTFLETALEQHGLTQHATMGGRDPRQPQPDGGDVIVTIELRNVSLQQIVDFLRDVDACEASVCIGSLQIRKAPNNAGQLDSVMEISSLRPSHPALASQLTGS